MKLRRLFRQAAAAAVAGAMTLSLCMPALAQTWNISNQPGFDEVYKVTVTGTANGRTVELLGYDEDGKGISAESTETTKTVLSDSVTASIALNGRSAPVGVALDGLDTKPLIKSSSGACISTAGSASVDLRGENALTAPVAYGIFSDGGALTLDGAGALNIRCRFGINVYKGSFTLNGGTVDMAAAETSVDGLFGGVSADTITLNGGSIHAVVAPSIYHNEYNTEYHDVLSAPGGIFIRRGSVETETVANNDPFLSTVRHRALYSSDGDIVISGGSVYAKGGELYAGGNIRISDGEVTAAVLSSIAGLTISGGTVTTSGFNTLNPIVLSGSAKVTVDSYLSEGALSRFDLSGLTTDGYLRYEPNGTPDPDDVLDDEGYIIIRGKLEPQSGGDAGNASGDAGSALAAVALGSAALWGGYEVATRVILHKLLPEGAAIPKTQAQLALLLWDTAGQPEPASAPAFAGVDDATAKAAQWCTEQGYLSGDFKPEKRVTKYRVIDCWNKAFPAA